MRTKKSSDETVLRQGVSNPLPAAKPRNEKPMTVLFTFFGEGGDGKQKSYLKHLKTLDVKNVESNYHSNFVCLFFKQYIL